ncbi:hypothetical protein PsYK624_028610 [Phanerochaete sordida]|uniref:Uncharacterized protein n=1 Tax=Phanerochaete sordida TaxID=48140 RepID=A0A9P3G353_9APHY|nr:hypothetical protein PsYK624_028610 [Phanerochaete sordida]
MPRASTRQQNTGETEPASSAVLAQDPSQPPLSPDSAQEEANIWQKTLRTPMNSSDEEDEEDEDEDEEGEGREGALRRSPSAENTDEQENNVYSNAEITSPAFKKLKKPPPAKYSTFFKLTDKTKLEDWRGLLSDHIDNALKLERIVFSRFSITFTVPRISPQPLIITIDDEKTYAEMIRRACKPKDPTVNIVIIEEQVEHPMHTQNLQSPKERSTKTRKKDSAERDHSESEEDAPPPKKSKKTKAPKASDIDPANQKIIDEIKVLRNKYTCEGNCASDHCYVLSDGEHLALGHPHFEAAKASSLRLETFPPNCALFDAVAKTVSRPSPVLERRLQQQRHGNGTQVNVTLTSELLNGLAGNLPANPRPSMPTPATAALNAPAPLPPVSTSETMLLPSSYGSGPRMKTPLFCEKFLLDEDREEICDLLQKEGYVGTQTFRFITLADLKATGFNRGQTAQLRDAVEMWAGAGDDSV